MGRALDALYDTYAAVHGIQALADSHRREIHRRNGYAVREVTFDCV